jgi:hypothetical protein
VPRSTRKHRQIDPTQTSWILASRRGGRRKFCKYNGQQKASLAPLETFALACTEVAGTKQPSALPFLPQGAGTSYAIKGAAEGVQNALAASQNIPGSRQKATVEDAREFVESLSPLERKPLAELEQKRESQIPRSCP